LKKVLLRTREERNILHTIKGTKANLIIHILRSNGLLKHFFEGKIKMTGRRKRRRKKLLDGLKGKKKYCKLR
jgi:hypothetical protein